MERKTKDRITCQNNISENTFLRNAKGCTKLERRGNKDIEEEINILEIR